MIKYNSHKTIINLQLIPLLPLTYTYIYLYNPYHTPTAISTPPTNITNLNSLIHTTDYTQYTYNVTININEYIFLFNK